MCKTLLPDVVMPEVHQNDHSSVHELSGPTFNSLHKHLALWVVTQKTSKKKKNSQNWRVGTCAGQYGICNTCDLDLHSHTLQLPF